MPSASYKRSANCHSRPRHVVACQAATNPELKASCLLVAGRETGRESGQASALELAAVDVGFYGERDALAAVVLPLGRVGAGGPVVTGEVIGTVLRNWSRWPGSAQTNST
jgi:hypothetical protein